MSQYADNFRPQTSLSSGQQYLDASIRLASPAKLRLMLTERAIEVAERLAAQWRQGQNLGENNEDSLTLLELLSELLSGITGGNTDEENQLCQKVADLYVFLIQHLLAAGENSDPSQIDEIRLVLMTEAETWRAACAQESPVAFQATSPAPHSGGLNFSA